MALTLGDNFSYQGAKPLDARLKYETVAAMKAVADATMYDGCLAYCAGTDKTYQWKSGNTVDETTGKWREFQAGGGSLSDLSDTDLSDPSDGDILAYDSVKEKWVNGSAGSVTIVHTYIPDLRPNYMESFIASHKSGVAEPVNVISGTMPNDTVIDDQLIVSIGGVMIRKSSVLQPETETDGELLADISILSGRSFSIEDTNVIDGTTYYYSAFPYSLEEKKFSRNSTNARVSIVAKTINIDTVTNVSYDTAYDLANSYVSNGLVNYENTIMIVNRDSYYSSSTNIAGMAWNNMSHIAYGKTIGNISCSSNTASPLVLTFNKDGCVVVSDANADVNNMSSMKSRGNIFSAYPVSAGDTLTIPISYSTWVSYYSSLN